MSNAANLFRQLVPGFKSLFEKRESINAPSQSYSSDAEGKFFNLWGWVLPLLLGLTAGWFGMVCLEIWLEGRNARNRPFAAASSIAVYTQDVGADRLVAFLRENPFGVTPMPAPYTATHVEEIPTQITGSLASAILRGTSPGYMAWMEAQGALRLVMVGDNFGEHTLTEVTPLDATFTYGEERVIKRLIFASRPAPATQQPPRLTAGRGPAASAGVVPPNLAQGTLGVVDRNTFNRLLEDPFDELRRLRIRPADTEQGLRVEWIAHDSILSQLGVQENDVIRAINGIVFRNTQDIMNSMNSMMSSDQFVVEVMRNGAPTVLQYMVQ